MRNTTISSSIAVMLSFSGLSLAGEHAHGHQAPALAKQFCHLKARAGKKPVGTVTFSRLEGGELRIVAKAERF